MSGLGCVGLDLSTYHINYYLLSMRRLTIPSLTIPTATKPPQPLHPQIPSPKTLLTTQPKYRISFLQKEKFDAYYRLCRFHQPIGAWLLYWPTAWGVCLGSAGVADPYLLMLFLMGSWTSRSAGCIVNDYLDRQFDRKVERTKSRPLASGEVTTTQAATLLFLNLCGGLFVLFNLNTTALFTTFGFVTLGALYPLAKRYTNYPQLILGMGFNSGILIGSLTANPTLLPTAISMYIGGIAWTMIYDTVYAYQDIDDDLKIGVKSTAVTWRDKNPKYIMEKFTYLMLICHLCLPLIDPDYALAAPFILGGDVLLIRQIRNLDLKDKLQCNKFFQKNNMYGMLVFFSLLAVGFVKTYRSYCLENSKKNK